MYKLRNILGFEFTDTNNLRLNTNSGQRPLSYKVYSVIFENSTNGQDLAVFKPAKVNGVTGLYDTVNYVFVPIPNSPIGSPTGETGGGGSAPDYSEDFSQINNNLDNIENEIKDTNDKLDNVNNSINETNDFLQDTTVNDSDFKLPSLDVSDPTANFFDTVFMGLYNAITSDEDKTISFKVMDYDVVLNSADFNFLSGSGFSVLSTFLNMAWVFGIGMFILRDVRKIIETIKNGEIDKIGKTDIKADVM